MKAGKCIARVLAALAVWAGTALGGTDISVTGDGVIRTDGSDREIYMDTAGSVGAGWDGADVHINTANTVRAGRSGVLGETMQWNAGRIIFDAAGEFAVVSSASGNGTAVEAAGADFLAGGTVTVAAGSAGEGGANSLVIHDLQHADASGGDIVFRVGAHSLLHVRNSAGVILGGINTADLHLTGGAAVFDGAVRLENGAVTASGSGSLLAAGGGLTLGAGGSLGAFGTELLIAAEADGSALGEVTLDGGVLDIRDGGTLRLGALTAAENGSFASAQQSGRLFAESMLVASGKTWTGDAGASLSIAGTAVLEAGAVYTAGGSGDRFGGMVLKDGAVLTGLSGISTAVTLGTENTPGRLEMGAGARIVSAAGTGNWFTVANADIHFIAPGGMLYELDSRYGGIDLSSSSITADTAGTIRFRAEQDIRAGAYFHKQGSVLVHGAGFSVLGAAVIGGEDAAAAVRTLVTGDGTAFLGGLTLAAKGSLESAGMGNASVTVGAAGGGTVLLSGGRIAAGGNEVFAVNAGLVHVNAGSGIFDAGLGSLDLSGSVLAVGTAEGGTGAASIAAANAVTLKSLSLLGGSAEAGGGTETLRIRERSFIGGGTAAAVFTASDAAVSFAGGLTLAENGVLESANAANTAAAVVSLGSAGDAGDLVMRGGALLRASGGNTLTFSDKSGSLSAFRVCGTGNAAAGMVDAGSLDVIVSGGTGAEPAFRIFGGAGELFTAGSLQILAGETVLGSAAATEAGAVRVLSGVTVGTGGTLTAEHNDAVITGSGSGSVFTAAAGSALRADGGSLGLRNFGQVVFGGSFTAGWNTAADAPAVLTSDADIVLENSASFGLTAELAARAAAGTTLVSAVGGAEILGSAPASAASMFGTFSFSIAGGTSLQVSGIRSHVTGDGSEADIRNAAANLQAMWGRRQLGTDLGRIVYGAAIPPESIGAVPGSAAGEKNIALFRALASPSGYSVSRNTLEYMTGAYNFGILDVSSGTARRFLREMDSRARSAAAARAAARNAFGSEHAYASVSAGEDRQGRFWLGGFGGTEKAGERQGFSGYSYDASGFVTGCDFPAAGDVTAGAAVSYSAGQYEDRGAARHDSEIRSWSAGVYASWAGPSGLTAAFSAAYTHSDNDIREYRHDPLAGGLGWSEADFRTGVWSVGGSLEREFRPAECFFLTPSAGLAWVHARSSDHEARLGGVLTQHERRVRNDGVLLPLELQAGYEFTAGERGRMRAGGFAGVTHNFVRRGIRGEVEYLGLTQAARAAVRSRESVRNTFRTGAEVQYSLDRLDAELRYDYGAGSGWDAHRVTGSVGILF